MKYSIQTLCAVVCLGFATLVQAEVAVIVNTAASAAPSQSDVGNIFLGKDKSMKGVDHKDWTPTKEKFYSGVANKSESQLKSYWSGLVFTGKGQPLPSVAGDAEVVAKVAAEADAIGYVDAAAVNDSVKVLFTLP
ncbi:phosphate ABC transporter substrate-binding protein [Pseudomonas leptonychotis]|jgi:ABC-type phosphate transport system substrate-binding protein|uniref:phosphate ABC transporter substrate-binding protein n=1 Tax=Pseudomonas leptonychotis TaxID=2448482 RepID=UPI003863C691